jgi:hypothetical protein
VIEPVLLSIKAALWAEIGQPSNSRILVSVDFCVRQLYDAWYGQTYLGGAKIIRSFQGINGQLYFFPCLTAHQQLRSLGPRIDLVEVLCHTHDMASKRAFNVPSAQIGYQRQESMSPKAGIEWAAV